MVKSSPLEYEVLAHGAERGRHLETTFLPEGVGSHTRTVMWKWCSGCRCWVHIDGIVGILAWMATHRDHNGSRVVRA